MLPSLAVLEKIAWKIKNIPNRKKESKRGVHFCCYLLCSKAGLRASEAIKFDLVNKTKQGLYRIEKPKGKNERLVYIPKRVIGELKKHDWQPNQTNRWNFYHFLRKIKRELNISKNIELTPHTLRRSFATCYAENGLPLPLLQRLLGHSSIRTTALYWQNIYGDDKGDTDTPNILAGKKWLENREKEPPQPTVENFPKRPSVNLEPIIKDKPVIPAKRPIQQDNSPLLTEISEKPAITQPQPLISGIPSQTSRIIKSEKEQESQKENILLTKIRNLEAENNNLKLLVQSEKQNNQLLRENIANLTHKIQADKQNHTNLTNAYQKALNDKARAELFAEKEKNQANNYQQQLKSIAKTLYQWQKINYYQQLEKEIYYTIQNPCSFLENKYVSKNRK